MALRFAKQNLKLKIKHLRYRIDYNLHTSELHGVSYAWEFKPIIQMYLILIACVIISPIGCLLIWEFLHYNMYSDIDFFPPSIVFQKVSVIKFYQMSLLDSNTCVCGKKQLRLGWVHSQNVWFTLQQGLKTKSLQSNG